MKTWRDDLPSYVPYDKLYARAVAEGRRRLQRRRRLQALAGSAVMIVGLASIPALTGTQSSRSIETVAPPAVVSPEISPPTSVGGTATTNPYGVLFQDDFSYRPAGGWVVRDQGGWRSEFADGGYRVTLQRGNGISLGTPLAAQFQFNGHIPNESLTIEMTAKMEPSSDDLYVGVYCRGKRDDYAGYRAYLRGDGFWAIQRFDTRGQDGKTLASANNRSAYAREVYPSEHAAGGPHHIRFDCLGTPSGAVTLALSVNGYKLAQVADEEALPPGEVTLSAGLAASAVAESASVVFDDFIVTRQR